MSGSLQGAALLAVFFLASPGCAVHHTPRAAQTELTPDNAFAAGVQILNTPTATGEVDFARAHELFVMAAYGRPGFANAHYNAGWTAERMEDLERAELHYRLAHELRPTDTGFVLAYADILEKNNKALRSAEMLEDFLVERGDATVVRLKLADTQLFLERTEEAIAQAREVLLRDAENVNAYLLLSRAFILQKRYALSQLCAERAKLLSDDPGIINNMGVTYLVMGERSRAVQAFQDARKRDPDALEANLNLGYVALSGGDYALAVACFQAALAGQPSNADAKNGLRIAKAALERRTVAPVQPTLAGEAQQQQATEALNALFERLNTLRDCPAAADVLEMGELVVLELEERLLVTHPSVDALTEGLELVSQVNIQLDEFAQGCPE